MVKQFSINKLKSKKFKNSAAIMKLCTKNRPDIKAQGLSPLNFQCPKMIFKYGPKQPFQSNFLIIRENAFFIKKKLFALANFNQRFQNNQERAGVQIGPLTTLFFSLEVKFHFQNLLYCLRHTSNLNKQPHKCSHVGKHVQCTLHHIHEKQSSSRAEMILE